MIIWIALGKSIGLKHIDKVSIKLVDEREEMFGYYHDKTRIININKNVSEDKLKTALAHEYLHFIWFEPESLLSTDGKLHSELVKLHGNANFHNHIKSKYIDKGLYHTSELFSFACTEFPDNKLEAYTLEQCNKWIDCSKLVIEEKY